MNVPRRFLLVAWSEDGQEVAAVGAELANYMAAEPLPIYVLKWEGSVEIYADLDQLERAVRPAIVKWID